MHVVWWMGSGFGIAKVHWAQLQSAYSLSRYLFNGAQNNFLCHDVKIVLFDSRCIGQEMASVCNRNQLAMPIDFVHEQLASDSCCIFGGHGTIPKSKISVVVRSRMTIQCLTSTKLCSLLYGVRTQRMRMYGLYIQVNTFSSTSKSVI